MYYALAGAGDRRREWRASDRFARQLVKSVVVQGSSQDLRVTVKPTRTRDE
jgi:hypothetical protein